LSSQYAEDIASSAIPAILAYRRGELIANLVHFVDELAPGTKLDESSVQAALTKYLFAFTGFTNLSRAGIFQHDERQSDDSF
jgi:hypothetical protein